MGGRMYPLTLEGLGHAKWELERLGAVRAYRSLRALPPLFGGADLQKKASANRTLQRQ